MISEADRRQESQALINKLEKKLLEYTEVHRLREIQASKGEERGGEDQRLGRILKDVREERLLHPPAELEAKLVNLITGRLNADSLEEESIHDVNVKCDEMIDSINKYRASVVAHARTQAAAVRSTYEGHITRILEAHCMMTGMLNAAGNILANADTSDGTKALIFSQARVDSCLQAAEIMCKDAVKGTPDVTVVPRIRFSVPPALSSLQRELEQPRNVPVSLIVPPVVSTATSLWPQQSRG
jgi:hypothetical protein